MQAHVPRGADGASPYRLAVVDPAGGRHRGAARRTTPSRSSTTTRPVASTRSPGPPTRSPRSSSGSASAPCGCCPGSTSRSTRPCSLPPSRRSASTCEAVDARCRAAGRPLGPEPHGPAVHARRRRRRPAGAPARLARALDRRAARARGGRRLIEVAPAARRRAHRPRPDHAREGAELLHSERDRDAVLDRDIEEERCERRCPPRWRCPPGRTRPLAPRLHPTGPSMPATRCEFVLALQARVRLDQLDPAETLDELFQGVSSRRNQVLIDLGREFGLSGAEGVQRQTLGELVKTLREQGAAYRFPGAYLREALAAGLSRARARAQRRGGAARVRLGPRPGPDRARARPRRARHAARPVGARRRARTPARGRGPARTSGRADRRRPRRHARARRRRGGAGAGAGRGAARRGPGRAAARARPRGRAPRAARRRAGGDPRERGRPALRRPPPRPLHLGLGERALGPRRRLPRRARRPARLRRVAGRDRPPRRPRAGHRRDRVLPRGPRGGTRVPGRRRDARACRAAARGRASDAGPRCRSAAPARRSTSPPTARRSSARRADDSRPRDLILGLASGAPDAPVTAPPNVAPALVAELGVSLKTAPDLRGEIALVTGASPGSIAAELARRLLRGGATVVVTTSTDTPARRRFYRDLYRTSAGPDAELHVVPANLASFGDIDALAEWLRARRGRAPGARRPADGPAGADAAGAVRRAADHRRRERGRPGLRDRAAPAAARRAAAGRRAHARAPCCSRCRPTTAASAATGRTARPRPRSRSCSAAPATSPGASTRS